MIVDSKGNAMGNYQKSATIAGKYIDKNFIGEWSNKGMSGLVKFTVKEGALEGNWKKGTEDGPMKGKWTGKLLSVGSAPPTKSPANKVTKAKKETKAKEAGHKFPSGYPSRRVFVPKVDPFNVLIYEKNWDEAIVYFEEHLYLSISKSYLGVGCDYCRALYRGSKSTERKGLEQLKEYLEDYPDHKPFLSYAGRIAAYLGEKEKDFEMLDEAITFYKKSGEKEKIAKVKETIKKLKDAKKETADKAKQALRDETIKKLKDAKKETADKAKQVLRDEAAEKQAAKEAAKSAKLKQHKFKSSKGEIFCKFCTSGKEWSNSDCHGREHGHNYVQMKVDGSFEPICNKCGCNSTWAHYSCS